MFKRQKTSFSGITSLQKNL